MNFRLVASLCLSTLILLAGVTLGQDVDLTGIKCIVNGKKAANSTATVKYKKGTVYFCCQNCASAFKEDVKLKKDAKFATKANHQLVLTGQFVQKGCPFSGSEIKEGTLVDVGGTKVGFCCDDCSKKVADAKDLATKAEMVFSNVSFKKGYHAKPNESASAINLADVKCMMMPKKGVSAEHAVDYKGGKVYFCCGGCAKKFSENTKDFATAANQQLVTSGQFVQTGCPISGGDVDDDEASKVGGVEIKFCCHRCKGKVDGATSDEDKAKLVFGEKRFDKAFSKK